MAFELKQFYRDLDASYDTHDLQATEEFLLASRQAAVSCPVVTSGSEGCMSCAPTLSVNLNYVCVSNELGCFYRGLSRWQESIEAFEAAQAEMEQYYATGNPEYGVVLLNKAGVYRYMGDLKQALAVFEQARSLLEAAEHTPPETLAGLYNNIGLVYLDLQDANSAVGLFSQAMMLLGDLNGHTVEYGTTCNNLAVAFQRLGQIQDALSAIDEAIRTLAEPDCGLNSHYPAALNTRGMLYYKDGRFTEALADFKTAAEKTKIIYGENIEYASACANCAACCKQLGDEKQTEFWNETEQTVLACIRK